MSMNQFSRLLQGQGGGGGGQPNADTPQVDTAEQIFVSSLALIKMLKHGAVASMQGTWGSLQTRTHAARCSSAEHAQKECLRDILLLLLC